MIRTLDWMKLQHEHKAKRIASQEQRRLMGMAQREAKQIVHSANAHNVSAECQQNASRDPDRKIGQGGLPSLGKRR
jgi:hypothetical protein